MAGIEEDGCFRLNIGIVFEGLMAENLFCNLYIVTERKFF